MLAASAFAVVGVVACSSSTHATTGNSAPRSSSSRAASPLPGPAHPITATSCPDVAAVHKATGVKVVSAHGGGSDSPGLYCGYSEVDVKPGSAPGAFQVLWTPYSLKEAFGIHAELAVKLRQGTPGAVAGVRAAPADFGGGAFEEYAGSSTPGWIACQIWLSDKTQGVYDVSGADARSIDAACASAETFARLLY
jgi:hypothetical protein